MDVALSRSITERVAPLLRVAREAAASDLELARVLDAIKAARREEMVASARLVAASGRLRMNDEQAAATLYVLHSPDVADMLMSDYGWSPERYESRLASMSTGISSMMGFCVAAAQQRQNDLPLRRLTGGMLVRFVPRVARTAPICSDPRGEPHGL